MTEQDAYCYALQVAGDIITEYADHLLDRDRSLSADDRAAVETQLRIIANRLLEESYLAAPPDEAGTSTTRMAGGSAPGGCGCSASVPPRRTWPGVTGWPGCAALRARCELWSGPIWSCILRAWLVPCVRKSRQTPASARGAAILSWSCTRPAMTD